MDTTGTCIMAHRASTSGWATPWRRTLALLVIVTTLLSGCTAPWPAGSMTTARTMTVLTDTAELTAIATAPDEPAATITQAEAIERAVAAITRADQARGVRAERVQLSLQADDGKLVMQPRHAWLVTFEGVEYSASPTCSCHVVNRPHTTVVLDADSGQLLSAFGSSA